MPLLTALETSSYYGLYYTDRCPIKLYALFAEDGSTKIEGAHTLVSKFDALSYLEDGNINFNRDFSPVDDSVQETFHIIIKA